MDSIGLRMRKLYAVARADGYQNLSRGALRRLPYALWVDGELSLSSTDPELIRVYWDHHLSAAVRDARAAKRWLIPLFYVYCHHFQKQEAEFQDFAQRIRQAQLIGTMSGVFLQQRLQHRAGIGAVAVEQVLPLGA